MAAYPSLPQATSPLLHLLMLAGVTFFIAGTAMAIQPTALTSFDALEEPTVRYSPDTDTFTPDDHPNIVDLGDGVFRMTLRYSSDGWDGDRNMTLRDRQRAEVKGLGPHQKIGETFEYRTTWRSNPEFRGSTRFCHLFQLMTTDGDNRFPLISLSIAEGQESAGVRVWPAGSPVVVREFPWTPNTWQTVRIRVRTSTTEEGEVTVSIDGDPFTGVHGVVVARPGGSKYRPKWGLYRGVGPDMPLGDDHIEHRNISAHRLGAPADDAHYAMELHAQSLAAQSPARALAWLSTQPDSHARTLARTTILTRWAEQDPAAALAVVRHLDDGREDAQTRIILRWAAKDAAAALAWLARHTPDPAWDDPLWYWATDTTLRYTDRAKALDGAGMIMNPQLRAAAIAHIARIWARTDAAAAREYVGYTRALSREQKDELLQKLP